MSDTQHSINLRLDSIEAIEGEIRDMFADYAPGHPGPDVMNDIRDREESISHIWEEIGELERDLNNGL